MKGKKVIGEKQNDQFEKFVIIFGNLLWTSVTSERYFSALNVKMNYITKWRILSASKIAQDEGWGHHRSKVMLILVRQPPRKCR